MRAFLMSYSRLVIYIILVAPVYSLADGICDSEKIFTPKWSPLDKTCVLSLDIDNSKKGFDLLLDFKEKKIIIGYDFKDTEKKPDDKTIKYKDMRIFKFSSLSQADTNASKTKSKVFNYSYRWDPLTSSYYEVLIIKESRTGYLNIFQPGAISFTNVIPERTGDNTMYSISQEKNTCNKKSKQYLVLKVNGKTKHLIDPDFKYSQNLSDVSSKSECEKLNIGTQAISPSSSAK